MLIVKALFDGHDIKPIEPINIKETTEVLIIFPNDIEKITPKEARKLLRGCGKGERLTEKLVKSRFEDIKLTSKFFF